MQQGTTRKGLFTTGESARNANPHLLRIARRSRQWTQADLAEHLGVSSLTVGRWERGESLPTRQNITELSLLFERSPQELGFLSDVSSSESSSPEKFLLDSMIPLPFLHQPMIGRDDLLKTILQRLDAQPTTIGLYGLPGAGKTTLALSLVLRSEIPALFPDGILWAGLGPHPDVSETLGRWASMLGIAVDGAGVLKSNDIWVKMLRERIGTHRMLIVLDDVWELSNALALTVGGPYCKYLLTTRFPLLATSFSPHAAISVPELSEQDGIELLQQIAPEITVIDAEKVRTLVRSVGALPLALTLAGRYLHVQGYGGQLRRLRGAMERLLDVKQRFQLSDPIDVPSSHPGLSSGTSLTLESMIAVTDHHLHEHGRKALRALSTFPAKPNTFSEEAALAVIAAPVEVLDTLVEAGLLQISARSRYTLHQTITDYALSTTNEDSKDAEERFVAYFANYIRGHSREEDIERESNNILTMLDAAFHRGMYNYLLQGACALAPFLLRRGLYDLAKSHLTRAYEATKTSGDLQDIATCLHFLGMVFMKQGEYQHATAHYREGLELARKVGIPEQICGFLSDLGWVTAKRGDYEQAYIYAQEGMNILHQINLPDSRCKLLTVLGVIADNRGEFALAKRYYQEGLILAQQNNDKDQQCVILNDLGVNASERGMWQEAFDYYQEMRQIAIQMRHLEWQCLSLLNLCAYHTVNAEYDLASKYNDEALLLTRQLGQREWESFALITQGDLALRWRKDYAQAAASLQEGLILATKIEKQHFICEALKSLGDLALECQRIDEAADFYTKMKHVIPDGQQGLNAECLYRRGLIAAARQETKEAENLGKAALGIFEKIGHRSTDEVRKWVAMGCPPSLPTYY